MTRERLTVEMDRLRDRVVAMADLVFDQLDAAGTVLRGSDPDLAERVAADDEDVNGLYREIETQCVDLLALQQPVAGDLRRVAAAFKISTDLERVGDLAVNLAQYGRTLDPDLYVEVSLGDILAMSRRMVVDSVELYVEGGDAWQCHELADRDNELDAMCAHAGRVVTLALIDHEADTDHRAQELVDDVSTILLAVRDLERVSDHAVNIAARTLYMTEGDDSLLQ
jgi:phosphate transport system protein